MAIETIDAQGLATAPNDRAFNEILKRVFGKINTNFTELSGVAGDIDAINDELDAIANALAQKAPLNHTHPVADLSDASADARTLMQAADYAAMRTLLDLEAGTDFYSKNAADAAFQPLDTELSALAALSAVQNLLDIATLSDADGNFIVGNGTAFVAESGGTARASLGLGTAAVLDVGTAANNVVQLDGTAKLPAVDGSQLTGIAAGGITDHWAAQPLGVPIPISSELFDTLDDALPPTDQAYRYIILTAGYSANYNSGCITGETVTGSSPNVVATAEISLVGSPFEGKTVNLLNSMRAFLRPGSSGTLQAGAVESHGHTAAAATGGSHTHTVAHRLNDGGLGTGGSDVTRPGGSTTTSSHTGHVHGVTVNDTGDVETRPRNMGVTLIMRIL